MAFINNYKRAEDTHQGGGLNGDYRVVIKSAEVTTSKSGKQMIKVELIPSGYQFSIFHYIVEGEYFNEKMSRFFDSFPSLGEDNFDFVKWIGAEGAAKLVPTTNGYTEVKYFISANKAEKLPPFQGEKPEPQEVASLDDIEGSELIGVEEEIPF